MSVVEPLLQSLAAGLQIWEHKEKTKYVDRFMKLREEWYQAYNSVRRDHAKLDEIKFAIENLALAFAGEVAKSTGVKL